MDTQTQNPPAPDPGNEPSLDDRMATAAGGGGVDAAGEDALLAYFLGDAPQPNAAAEKDFEVELGDGRTWKVTVRAIDWPAWKDAQEKAVNTDGNFDIFTQASYVVARSMVKPMLGKMLQRIRDAAGDDEDAKARVPADGAALLRNAFRRQAGSLIYLQRRILELSKLDEASNGGVKEVEAGKL